MNTKEIESWLEKNVGFENPRPGLDRVVFALKELQLEPNAKIITVTGTNGKGSVARALHASLSNVGNTALFTSPHLVSINERFIFNSQKIDLDQMLSLLQSVFYEIKLKGVHLSFFEVLFVSFIKWISKFEVNYIVLEVGLGGRWDATNALDADIAIITSISRDHQDYLGHTYKKILLEKIGISRPNKPLITSFDLNYLNQIVKKENIKNNFDWIRLDNSSYEDFSLKNNNIVTKTLELLGVGTSIPEINNKYNYGETEIEFFGSHNPDAVRKLVQFLSHRDYTKEVDLILISFSKRSISDLTQMIKIFKNLQDEFKLNIVFTAFSHFKAEKSEVIEKLVVNNGLKFDKEYKKYFSQTNKHKIICTGSNYFNGLIMSELNLSF